MSKESKTYKNMPKKVYIRTFGCQMNIRDSEIISGLLLKDGYQLVRSEAEADIILFNTCSVRQHAEQRVWSRLGMLGKVTKSPSQQVTSKRNTQYAIRNTKIIGLVGCMAQYYQEEIFRRAPQVNLVCGPANIYDIPGLLEKVNRENTRALAVDKLRRPLHTDCGSFRTNHLKAYVSIMEGCNNFCSYCIVPYVRGRQLSRPRKHILDEVKDLAERGYKEIMLLGQNVNSYGKDLRGKMDFARLLEQVDKIKGIERIRFITSHPKDASGKLFLALRDLPKLCEHLHLPLQSGADKILRLMNRGYTFKDYLKLVDDFRSKVSDCSLTTDIIVGFPGESQEDFQKTYDALERIRFDEAFIFKYSPRPKTKAAGLKDDVALEEKQRRNQLLLKLQEKISRQKNAALVGKCVEVLTEGPGRCLGTDKDVLQGRSRTNKVTLFCAKRSLIAQLVTVKINRATTHTLIGEINGQNN